MGTDTWGKYGCLCRNADFFDQGVGMVLARVAFFMENVGEADVATFLLSALKQILLHAKPLVEKYAAI